MRAISNSSPLIALSNIKRIDLLREIFASVSIPEEVRREVFEAKRKRPPDWLETLKVKDRIAVDALNAVVDSGEAEAIILAKEMDIKSILIDDKKGVNLARKLGLEVIRTTTVIGIAYKIGLLADLREELLSLRKKGYWITDYYIEEILRKFSMNKQD